MDAIIVFILIVIGAWLVCLFFILRRYIITYTSKNWPETVGRISDGGISHGVDSNDNDVYYAWFEFTYQVSGSELQGYFQIMNFMCSSSYAESALAKHRVGTTLPVRYNPSNSKEYITEFNRYPHQVLWAIFAGITISLLILVPGLIKIIQ